MQTIKAPFPGVLYNSIAAAQTNGLLCALLDYLGDADPDIMSNYGVDPNAVYFASITALSARELDEVHQSLERSGALDLLAILRG